MISVDMKLITLCTRVSADAWGKSIQWWLDRKQQPTDVLIAVYEVANTNISELKREQRLLAAHLKDTVPLFTPQAAVVSTAQDLEAIIELTHEMGKLEVYRCPKEMMDSYLESGNNQATT